MEGNNKTRESTLDEAARAKARAEKRKGKEKVVENSSGNEIEQLATELGVKRRSSNHEKAANNFAQQNLAYPFKTSLALSPESIIDKLNDDRSYVKNLLQLPDAVMDCFLYESMETLFPLPIKVEDQLKQVQREVLLKIWERMLNFYGFKSSAEGEIYLNENAADRLELLIDDKHNDKHKKILLFILKYLSQHHLDEQCEAFIAFCGVTLSQHPIYNNYLSTEILQQWLKALNYNQPRKKKAPKNSLNLKRSLAKQHENSSDSTDEIILEPSASLEEGLKNIILYLKHIKPEGEVETPILKSTIEQLELFLAHAQVYISPTDWQRDLIPDFIWGFLELTSEQRELSLKFSGQELTLDEIYQQAFTDSIYTLFIKGLNKKNLPKAKDIAIENNEDIHPDNKVKLIALEDPISISYDEVTKFLLSNAKIDKEQVPIIVETLLKNPIARDWIFRKYPALTKKSEDLRTLEETKANIIAAGGRPAEIDVSTLIEQLPSKQYKSANNTDGNHYLPLESGEAFPPFLLIGIGLASSLAGVVIGTFLLYLLPEIIAKISIAYTVGLAAVGGALPFFAATAIFGLFCCIAAAALIIGIGLMIYGIYQLSKTSDPSQANVYSSKSGETTRKEIPVTIKEPERKERVQEEEKEEEKFFVPT